MVTRGPLPIETLFFLGQHAHEPGFVQFLVDCRDDGFALECAEDEALSDDEWREVVTSRTRVLSMAWESYKERVGASTRDGDAS